LKVLLVEDSVLLQDRVARGLRRAGYAVDAVGDGKQGLMLARTRDYDVVVLDLLLPELDGLSVLRTLRECGNRSHVLILTAKDAVEDRVKGLRSGADDYLVKPFDFDELLARVEALARRRYDTKDPRIRVGDLTVDTAAKKALIAGAAIELTPREYALLEYLAFRRGKPVSRLELEDHLYEDRKQVLSNAIDSAVCTLRAKLEAGGAQPLVHTRRGVGYVLEDRASGESAQP